MQPTLRKKTANTTGTLEEKLALLRGVDLFSSLEPPQLQVIAQMAVEKRFRKNQSILLEEETQSQSFFLIAEGQVKVYLSGLDGREAILAILKDGEFFGEMSLLDGAPRSASVRSVQDTRLFVITRDQFLAELKLHPELALAMLGEMSRRLRRSNRQISSLALMTVLGRIAACLIELMEERGQRIRMKDGTLCTVIRDRPTQQQIAEMAGTTRETVSRVLNHLQKKGYIVLNGKDLHIIQEEELKSKE